MKFTAFVIIAMMSTPLSAHGVDVSRRQAWATVLTLTHADGSPIAQEHYQVYPEDSVRPVQEGRTDTHGRVVFLPDKAGQWRLKVFSEDGHGVNMGFAAAPGEQKVLQTPSDFRDSVAGLGVLLGIFGLYQMYLRRRELRQ